MNNLAKLIGPKEMGGRMFIVDGETFVAKNDGTLELPADRIPSSVWGYGFVYDSTAAAVDVDRE